ncbi:MAG: M48 family metallopeptidase, partial [Methylophilaceae bacterium]|nr:M48 family metallopeptidase [Methylophilaceae bacterium]
MTAAFTALFIVILAATVLVRAWLGLRHIGHVTVHRGAVPAAFATTIRLEDHQKAADYTIAKTRLMMADGGVQAVFLLILTIGGGLQAIDTAWRSVLPEHELLRGALVVASVFALSGLVDIPLGYYKTFVVDARFGFNRMSPAMFFTDLVKHALIGMAFGGPLLFAALWLMQSANDLWWFYLWIIWSGF